MSEQGLSGRGSLVAQSFLTVRSWFVGLRSLEEEMNHMQTIMSGAACIRRSLEDMGVKHVFGYSGAAILPVFQELGESALCLSVNSNEQSCAFSAAGVSRSGGGVGVAVVTSGPAITNTLTAVADAYGDSVPLLVISGQVPTGRIGTDAFQHIDVSSIFSSVAKRVFLVSVGDDVESVVKEAYALAVTGKPGPVVVDVPKDVQLADVCYEDRPLSSFLRRYASRREPSDKECSSFFSLLKAARRPLLYVGGGAAGASSELRAFNDRFGIPHVNTLMGKGVLAEDDALSLGMLGMFGTPEANTAIRRTDFFFAVGVRWDDRVAEKVGEFALQARIAYVDVNPEKVAEIERERRPQFTFTGDATCFLRRLCSYAAEHDIRIGVEEWRDEVRAINGRFVYAPPADGPLRQGELVRQVDRRLDKEGMVVVTGVGNHQMFAAQRLKMREPRRFLSSGSFGTMGFALPTAVGVRQAFPERGVLVIDGDGSLKMNFGELCTIGAHRLDIKVLVLNNRGDGMVRNLQDSLYEGRRVGTSRPAGERDVRFFEVADRCGFVFSRRVSSRGEVEGALDAFFAARGPAFLECVTAEDEAVYPRIEPGRSYQEMVLGPFLREE